MPEQTDWLRQMNGSFDSFYFSARLMDMCSTHQCKMKILLRSKSRKKSSDKDTRKKAFPLLLQSLALKL